MSAPAPLAATEDTHKQQLHQREEVQRLQQQVAALQVAHSELASLKPGRAVYLRRGELLLVAERSHAAQHVNTALKQAHEALCAAESQAAEGAESGNTGSGSTSRAHG